MGQTGRVTPLVTVTEDREEAAPPFVVTSGHSPGLWFCQSLVSAWLLGSFSSLGLPSSSILRNDTNYRFPRSTAVPNKFLCDHFMLSCMLKNSSTVLISEKTGFTTNHSIFTVLALALLIHHKTSALI